MISSFFRYLKLFQKDRHFSVLAFLIFICPLAFSYYLYENFETPKYFLWLCLVGWSAAVFPWRIEKGIRKNLIILFSAWLVLASISTLLSADFINSVFGFYYRFTSSLLFYLSWAFFVIILAKSLDENKKIFVYQILVFDSFLIAILGLLQSFGIMHYDGPAISGLYRAPSFLGNPNFSSMFMAMVLPLAVKFAVSASNLRQKLYYYCGIFLTVVSLLVLASRGAVMAAVFCLLFLAVALVFKKNNKKLAFKSFGVLLFSIIIFFAVVSITRPEGFFKVFKKPDTNVVLRLKLWQTTIKGIERVPFFGEGPGNFQIFFEKTRGLNFANEQGVFDDAHNIFLQMAATSGIPFLFVFLFIIGYGVYLGVKRKEEGLDENWKWAEISSVLAFVIAGSFNPVAIPCFLGFGAVLAGLYSSKSEQVNIIEGKKKIEFKNIWFWTGLLMVYFGFAIIFAEFTFAYGYRAYFKGEYAKAEKFFLAAKIANPTYFIYELYLIGSDIRLGKVDMHTENRIEKYTKRYGTGARAYVQGSNLYYLAYRATGSRKYVEKAIETYKKALDHDPYFGERYGQMGVYYYVLSDFDTAKKYAEMSLKLKPNHIPTLVLLAKICQQLNLNEQGIKAIEEAYLISPNNFQLKVWNYRAKYFKDLNKVGLEVQVYEGKLE